MTAPQLRDVDEWLHAPLPEDPDVRPLRADDFPLPEDDGGAISPTPTTTPARPRFTLYDDADLAALPTPTWLIDQYLPANGLAVLIGEKGALKTFLALDWSLHVFTGLDWNGHPVQPGTAVYVYAEGRTGIRPRLEAWKAAHGVREPVGVLFLPQRLSVNDLPDVAALLTALEAKRGRRDASLIVIDTLNRNFAGNENSSEDMTAFVRGCDLLREQTGATVLVLHHKGHGDADRGRGSSVLDAAADTVIFAHHDKDLLTLSCQKQKDAAPFPDLELKVLEVAGSLALKGGGVKQVTVVGRRRDCLLVLHQHSTDKGITHKTWFDAAGMPNSSFSKALKWLLLHQLVSISGGKYRVSDAGRAALTPPSSTATPPLESGAGPELLHHRGDIYISPGGVSPVDHGEDR